VSAQEVTDEDGDFRAPLSTWARVRGHSAGGAVLVRPDRFVGWRSADSEAIPKRLGEVMRMLLGFDEA
jgi:2,4-dichlorophenol 6-monooxygenase